MAISCNDAFRLPGALVFSCFSQEWFDVQLAFAGVMSFGRHYAAVLF